MIEELFTAVIGIFGYIFVWPFMLALAITDRDNPTEEHAVVTDMVCGVALIINVIYIALIAYGAWLVIGV